MRQVTINNIEVLANYRMENAYPMSTGRMMADQLYSPIYQLPLAVSDILAGLLMNGGGKSILMNILFHAKKFEESRPGLAHEKNPYRNGNYLANYIANLQGFASIFPNGKARLY